MDDLKPFKHGQEGTHWACQNRLLKEGQKAICCECNPHENCGREEGGIVQITKPFKQ